MHVRVTKAPIRTRPHALTRARTHTHTRTLVGARDPHTHARVHSRRHSNRIGRCNVARHTRSRLSPTLTTTQACADVHAPKRRRHASVRNRARTHTHTHTCTRARAQSMLAPLRSHSLETQCARAEPCAHTHTLTNAHAHVHTDTHTLTRSHTLAHTCTYECSSARPHPRVGSRARRPDQGHTRQRRTMGTHPRQITHTHTHTHVRPWAHSHVHPHAHTCTHTQTQNNDARALIHNQKGTPTRVYAPRPARQESHTHASAQPPLISTRVPVHACAPTHTHTCTSTRVNVQRCRAAAAVQSRQCA